MQSYIYFPLTIKSLNTIMGKANDNYYHLSYVNRKEYIMTLSEAKVGKVYIVKSFDFDIKTVRRLEALGMTRGTKINVINRNRGGAVIFMVRGTRLALGKQIAESIEVVED